MAIHERGLVEQERIIKKDRIVIDGVDASGDWNLIILPRVINDYDLDFAKDIINHPQGKTINQCYQCSYCTASCPVHNYWDEKYNPRHFIYLASTHRCPKGVLVEEVLKVIVNQMSKRGLIEEYPSKKFDKFFTESVIEYGRIEDGELLFGWMEKQGFNVMKDPILKKPIPFAGGLPDWLKSLAIKPLKGMNIDFLILNAKHMLIHPRTQNWNRFKQVLERVIREEGIMTH
jgi:heterodisulfide reductase subunit C